MEQVTEGGDMKKPYQRKTYKQLKDTVTVKRGAIWQEACDDGTQEYVLLTTEHNKDPRNTQCIYDRSLVENDKKHFAEVFQVEPQYMTREELDQWEAFKSRKKPGRKAAPKLTAEKVDEWRSKPRKRRVSAKERNRRSEAMKAAWARRKAQKAA
jgi:hypothetical protein